jgi:hypothetical protein
MPTEPDNQSSTPVDPPSLISAAAPVDPAAPPADPPVDPNAPPAEPAKVEPAAPASEPLTLEAIKFPEGFTVDDEASKSFLEVMNDDKLSGAERAQKLIDLQSGLMQKVATETQTAWENMQMQWQDQVRADPEIGGEKLAPTLGEVSKLVDKYGSPELRQVFDLTGAGNHPQVIKFLHNIAKDLSEGGPVLGAPAVAKEALADRMYPSMKPKQGA